MTPNLKDKRRSLRRVFEIVWTICFIVAGGAFGALVGWNNHGFVAAIALAFVGAVAGGFISRPDLLLQILT